MISMAPSSVSKKIITGAYVFYRWVQFISYETAEWPYWDALGYRFLSKYCCRYSHLIFISSFFVGYNVFSTS